MASVNEIENINKKCRYSCRYTVNGYSPNMLNSIVF